MGGTFFGDRGAGGDGAIDESWSFLLPPTIPIFLVLSLKDMGLEGDATWEIGAGLSRSSSVVLLVSSGASLVGESSLGRDFLAVGCGIR